MGGTEFTMCGGCKDHVLFHDAINTSCTFVLNFVRESILILLKEEKMFLGESLSLNSPGCI